MLQNLKYIFFNQLYQDKGFCNFITHYGIRQITRILFIKF